MNRIFLSAVLAAAGLIGLAGSASATTFTISFTGVVSSAFNNNTSSFIPDEVGKSISGKIFYGGTATDVLSGPPQDEATGFDRVKYSVKAGSAPFYSATDNNSGVVFLHSGNDVTASFDGDHELDLQMHWKPSSQLGSLATFPSDDIAAAIFFGTPMSSSIGHAVVPGPVSYTFTVTSFTTAYTPLPASAWLFVAALGVLGGAAWRRRGLASSTVPVA